MSTTEANENHDTGPLLGLGSSEGLGGPRWWCPTCKRATPSLPKPAEGRCAMCSEHQLTHRPHEFDDDACCIHCGFDGAEWAHWKRNTYEGKASDARQPLCLAA